MEPRIPTPAILGHLAFFLAGTFLTISYEVYSLPTLILYYCMMCGTTANTLFNLYLVRQARLISVTVPVTSEALKLLGGLTGINMFSVSYFVSTSDPRTLVGAGVVMANVASAVLLALHLDTLTDVGCGLSMHYAGLALHNSCLFVANYIYSALHKLPQYVKQDTIHTFLFTLFWAAAIKFRFDLAAVYWRKLSGPQLSVLVRECMVLPESSGPINPSPDECDSAEPNVSQLRAASAVRLLRPWSLQARKLAFPIAVYLHLIPFSIGCYASIAFAERPGFERISFYAMISGSACNTALNAMLLKCTVYGPGLLRSGTVWTWLATWLGMCLFQLLFYSEDGANMVPVALQLLQMASQTVLLVDLECTPRLDRCLSVHLALLAASNGFLGVGDLVYNFYHKLPKYANHDDSTIAGFTLLWAMATGYRLNMAAAFARKLAMPHVSVCRFLRKPLDGAV